MSTGAEVSAIVASSGDHKTQAERLSGLLTDLLKNSQPNELLANLQALVQNVLSDENVSVVVARMLVADVVARVLSADAPHKPPNEAVKQLATFVLGLLQPRVISYEEQAAAIRQRLADIYESEREWRQAAQVLIGIPLEAGQREENVWQWCDLLRSRRPELLPRSCVVFISNRNKTIPLWMQKAASDSSDGRLVVWDYHVIGACLPGGAAPLQVIDFDTLLPCPCDAASYCSAVITDDKRLKEVYRRRFGVMRAAEYLELFSSDRRHMRHPSGGYLHPPPPWPPIFNPELGHNLDSFWTVHKECSQLLAGKRTLTNFDGLLDAITAAVDSE